LQGAQVLPGNGNLFRRIIPRAVVGWVVFSTVLGRSFTALGPSPGDSSLFAYFGYEWLHGQLLYARHWDNKPPGIFLVDALTFRFFPKSFTALAFVEGFFILGCAATVYFLMREWGAPKRLCWMATLMTAVACNLETYNQLGNLTEIYVLWPAVMSMYCFARAKPMFGGKWIFIAGVSSGIAALFKPVGIAPFLAQTTFIVSLALLGNLRLRQAIRSTGLNLAGIVSPWLPFVAYFGRHGELGQLFNASIFYDIRYGLHSQSPLWMIPFHFAVRLEPVATLVVSSLVGVVLFVFYRQLRPPDPDTREAPNLRFFWSLGLLWAIYDSAGVVAGGRFYPHYFLCLLPSLCIVATFTCWFLISLLPKSRQGDCVAHVLLVLVAAPLLLPQFTDLQKIHNVLTDQGATLAEVREAARFTSVSRFIDMHRRPGATLFTWDYLPAIYFDTGLASASRFLDAHYTEDSPQAFRTIGAQIIRDLHRTPPTFVVDATEEPHALAQSNSLYRQFLQFITAHYELKATLPGPEGQESVFRVYEIRTDP
jgi:Dolichyl-phosphate-mannose-protein mannosyltransferase